MGAKFTRIHTTRFVERDGSVRTSFLFLVKVNLHNTIGNIAVLQIKYVFLYSKRFVTGNLDFSVMLWTSQGLGCKVADILIT